MADSEEETRSPWNERVPCLMAVSVETRERQNIGRLIVLGWNEGRRIMATEKSGVRSERDELVFMLVPLEICTR